MADGSTYMIYHKPGCSKCRTLAESMEKANASCNWVAYLQKPPDEETLTGIIKRSGLKVRDFIRTGEELYHTKFAGKKKSDKAWIKVLVKYPELLQRPIVLRGDKVWIARDEETIKLLLNS